MNEGEVVKNKPAVDKKIICKCGCTWFHYINQYKAHGTMIIPTETAMKCVECGFIETMDDLRQKILAQPEATEIKLYRDYDL
jgi:hypothetical protein